MDSRFTIDDSPAYLRYLGAGDEVVSRNMTVYNTQDQATSIDGGVGGLPGRAGEVLGDARQRG